MNIKQTIDVLSNHNKWRRGADTHQEEPEVLGIALECACSYLKELVPKEEEKTVPMEIDMADWDREILYYLITESVNRNVSVNQIIVDCLDQFIKQHETPTQSN